MCMEHYLDQFMEKEDYWVKADECSLGPEHCGSTEQDIDNFGGRKARLLRLIIERLRVRAPSPPSGGVAQLAER